MMRFSLFGTGRFTREDLRLALTVTRREVRDAVRDWRIVIPILLLTLGFPLLMNITADRIMNFVTRFDSVEVGDRLIPLLLMIVGFFPTSFSLVIALETFVGEKERKSLEPLLATPLTNTQLYLGKVLASLVPPLLASFLGIGVYSVAIAFTVGWTMPLSIFILVIALTTVQAILMVSGAVVVSSQTTSVRAANLLASFIIVPMALLIQFEAAMMFWGNRSGLWLLLCALIIVCIILIRIGIKLFNREELLGRDLDQLKVRWIGSEFKRQFLGPYNEGRFPGIRQWYRDLFIFVRTLRPALMILLLALVGGLALGLLLADRYPLPKDLVTAVTNAERSAALDQLQLLSSGLPWRVFGQNIRALAVALILGIFSLGVAGLGVFVIPWTMIGYISTQFGNSGPEGLVFLLLALLPHGIIELPALLVAAAAGLRWHTIIMVPSTSGSLSESWIRAAADFARVLFGLVLPLLLIAAFVEAYVTPAILDTLFG